MPVTDYQLLKSQLASSSSKDDFLLDTTHSIGLPSNLLSHSNQTRTGFIAALMSACGKLKMTSLGWKDKLDFIKYYESRQKGQAYQRMKKEAS